jgi:hypothetical protein
MFAVSFVGPAVSGIRVAFAWAVFLDLLFKARNDLPEEVLKGVCGHSNHGTFDGIECF